AASSARQWMAIGPWAFLAGDPAAVAGPLLPARTTSGGGDFWHETRTKRATRVVRIAASVACRSRASKLECWTEMATDSDNIDRIIGERRAKGEAMRDAGENPFANDWKPELSLAELRARYQATRPAAATKGPIVPIDGQSFKIAGRALTKRGFGKTM